MRTLFIECGMGAAGDMLTAALIDLLPNSDEFVEKLNSIGIPKVEYIKNIVNKNGINGVHMTVSIDGIEEDEHIHDHHHNEDEHGHHHSHHESEYDHEHHHHEHTHHHAHSSLKDISHIVSHLNIPQKVKEDVVNVYNIIAEAESYVHGTTVDNIHFHEVGSMDAIADVTAVCLLMNELNPDRIVVSPINVGSGYVKCAHGVLPVPAPATAYILKGCPTYSGEIKSELCTPTGAALLKYFATSFSALPEIIVDKIGHGMGKKEFEVLNCVRAILGHSDESKESVIKLECNIDDMTAEDISFAMDKIFEAGALEVFTTAVGMKKNRPGILLTVICKEAVQADILNAIFKHTSTIGIRESICNRYVLNRTFDEIETEYGPLRRKISEGYGVKKIKIEHDDLEKIARENNLSISDVRNICK